MPGLQLLKARTLILVFNWVCAIVLSYTIALNVKDLGGNVFANHTFSLLMSAVGILFSNLLIVKQGKTIRHWLHLQATQATPL